MSATSLSGSSERRGELALGARTGTVRALVRRDWGITRSYRTALVTDLVFGMLNLVAYYYISKTFKSAVHHGLGTAPSYFAFAAAGVALAVVLQAAISGVSRRLREEQLTGTLEALYAQPISPGELALGLAGFPCVFAVARAFVYLLLAGVFLGLSFAHCDWPGLVCSFLLSGLAFAGLGVGLAAIVLVFKRADAVGVVGVFGLSLLGGAFFPTQVLPHWLRLISALIPTHYAFVAVRRALFGGAAWGPPAAALAGIGLLTMLAALTLFDAALRYAVRQGTLNQY